MSPSSQSTLPLASGSAKPFSTNRRGRQVVFADDVGVGTAARELDHAKSVLGRQGDRAGPHPVLAFRLGQRIKVDDRIPGGLRRAIAVERRAPPDALRVRGITPEIIEERASPLDPGDAVGCIQDVEHRLAVALELRVTQCGQRLGIARPHPCLRGRTVDLLEPEKRILGRAVMRHVENPLNAAAENSGRSARASARH